ncbi:MAG: class I SAM-dependent methyltransferase [Myxococcales bacterium]|nr:class I SAM-dependent methyltransferase [Myxococcales bacterium]MCB9521850.1 class I SAM-dependent methyltransferase [Myxococcales bacterium]
MTAPVPLESPPCPVCAGARYRPTLTRVRDLVWRKPGEFTLAQCDGCGLVATRPRPTPDALGFYYEDAYSGEAEQGMRHFQTESGLGKLIARYRLGVLQKVRPLSAQDRLLDVGCSYGGFLRVAREATGCRTTGLDADEGSIAQAVDQDACDYRVGHLVDQPDGAGSFECITFFESLEHHPEPVAALRKAYALLAPGGACVVEVPNFGGFWRKVFGRYWLPLLTPQHLFHFTPATLARAFEAAGFPTVTRQHTMFYPLEGVASLGLWLGKVLRSPPPGSPPSWRTPFDLVLVLLLVALYFVVEVPSQALLRLLNASGHQIAVARKPAATQEAGSSPPDEGPAPTR